MASVQSAHNERVYDSRFETRKRFVTGNNDDTYRCGRHTFLANVGGYFVAAGGYGKSELSPRRIVRARAKQTSASRTSRDKTKKPPADRRENPNTAPVGRQTRPADDGFVS